MTLKPQRPYRLLRSVVGTGLIGAVVALWVHGHLTGDELGALWTVVMLALVVASGYAVFGRRTMQSALEDAQEVASEGGDGSDGGE